MKLESFIGQKLLWVGKDEESERTYLLFERMSALAVDEAVVVEDGLRIADDILKDKLEQAEHILSLKAILATRVAVETHGCEIALEDTNGRSQSGTTEEDPE